LTTIHAATMPTTGTSSVNGTTALVGYFDSSVFQMPYPMRDAATAVVDGAEYRGHREVGKGIDDDGRGVHDHRQREARDRHTSPDHTTSESPDATLAGGSAHCRSPRTGPRAAV